MSARLADLPLVAAGASLQDCIYDLVAQIEAWVEAALANGWELPVIDGLDLNSTEGQALAARHHFRSAS